MGSFTNYTEKLVLNAICGQGNALASISQWIGLFTTAPTDASGGTEVSGNNYGRKSVGAFSSATALIANTATVTFATATAAWGTVTSFATFDDSSTGNMISWGTLTAAREISTNDIAVFAVGSLTISLD